MLRKGGLAALVASLLLVAGCGGGEKDNDDGWFTLVLVPAAGTDPFNDPGAEFLYLRIEDFPEATVLEEQQFAIGGDYVLDDAPTGRQIKFFVEIRDGTAPVQNVIAEGESGPHAVLKDEHTTVTVVLDPPI